MKRVRDRIIRTNEWHRKLMCRLTAVLLLASVIAGCRKEETAEAEHFPLSVYFYSCSEDADSILLHMNDTDIMIDTGIYEDSAELIGKLEKAGVSEIDLLILTHPDQDHIGGAAKVLEKFPVEQIVQTNAVKGSKLQESLNAELVEEKVLEPEKTQHFTYGELKLTVYPPREESYENTNNYSIAVLAEYGGQRFFFAGDAKKKRIKELLSEKLPQVDVYKCTHHGRDEGKGTELIELLQPSIAVVTAAAPEEETERALERIGTEIYTTLDTDVLLKVSEKNILVEEIPDT